MPKPQVTLTDTAGQPFSLPAQTNSKLTLLYFGYTHCPDVCPTHMAAIGTALKNLPPEVADHVRVVFVTTDPARDTAQVLRSWLDHFDPDGRHYVGLTGTPQAIAATEQAFGVPPAVREDLGHGQYGVSHAAYVIAFTPDGLAHLAYPSGIRAQDWAHDLQRLATRGWQPA